MPRFDLGFDLDQFLNHCRQVKPPYDCPIAACGRNYRSYTGIANHMTSFDHENAALNTSTAGNTAAVEPEPPAIPTSTDLKFVEFQLDGKPAEISVYDHIEIFSKEQFEASMPPVVEEPKVQEQAKTPSMKTPKTPKARNSEKGVDVQRYTIENKKTNQLPEASFTIIDSYYDTLPDAPKQTEEYVRFVEKTQEELDAEVEYDMDEEDMAWLRIINDQRSIDGYAPVKHDQFELLMDRLEKESFFQAQSTGRDSGIPIDEDAVCCICMDGECQNSNVILFCDMCNLAVHQECYGVPYIPEGQWLCRRCLQSPSRAVDCALCPNKGGAFKQTDDGRWAHVVCAMWIPEVCFANTVFLEPIDSIGNIPAARWKLTCYICKQRGVGACIQCNKVNCYTAFHVTCAQQAGLHMKIDAVGETSANGTSVIVRKAAYCDMHTPADSDARPQIDEFMDAAKKAAAKAASRQKMKKARKILAEKRSAAPIVSVPTIPPHSYSAATSNSGLVNSIPSLPWNKIQKLAELVTMDRKPKFILRMLAYWTLKRQSRNGVPLLRRLTSSYPRRNNTSLNKSNSLSPEMKKTQKKTVQKKKVPQTPVQTEEVRLQDEIKYWQRLRQDLERARLLCELIRKREKTKRELIRIKAEESLLQLSPFMHLILKAIDLIQEKDIQQIFAEPVDFEEVLDYLEIVKHPMDLSTMRQKAQTHQYQDIDQFASDFYLMIDNCLTYNNKETIFYKAAVKLRHQGVAIIRQLRRDYEIIGFDLKTGLHLTHRPKHIPEPSDDMLLKDIDAVLSGDFGDTKSMEEKERILLETLDKANTMKNANIKYQKVKAVRTELAMIRRKKLSLKNSMMTYDTEDTSQDDSEVDNSSAVDDEAEPGKSSRASSPAVKKKASLGGQGSKASTPVPEVTPIRKKGRGRQPSKLTLQNNEDPKQKKIENFFSKANSKNCDSDDIPSQEDIPVTSTPKVDPPRRRGRPPKKSIPSSPPPPKNEEEEFPPDPNKDLKDTDDENSVSSSPSGVNRRTAVLFTKKAGALTKPSSGKKGRMRTNSENGPSASCDSEESACEKPRPAARNKKAYSIDSYMNTEKKESPSKHNDGISLVELNDNAKPPAKESFKVYRQGGDIPGETDEETQSESNSSINDSDSESGSDSDSDGAASDSSASSGSPGTVDGLGPAIGDDIPLEPLDLVWAKCRGYPWYPALIINPKMPRTGYFHNKVPIPVPPEDVLALVQKYDNPVYLVLFFDTKRTWQWLPRNKLEPLGVNSDLDKAKLVESRKPAERNAVKKAYEKAILHRCRVTGENTGLSGESDNEATI